MAIMLMANVDRICVCLKRRLRTWAALPSRLRTMTMRIPLRSLSSRRSAIPSIFRSRTRSAIESGDTEAIKPQLEALARTHRMFKGVLGRAD